jgi:hypothetical protein
MLTRLNSYRPSTQLSQEAGGRRQHHRHLAKLMVNARRY